MQDTCGVHNLHGMPGILGGVIGAISTGFAEIAFENDKGALVATFKALAADKRSISEQGWIQLGALGITLVVSILSGALCGYLASHVGKSGEGANDRFNLFADDGHWEGEDGMDIDYNLGETIKQVETTAAQHENKIVDQQEEFNEEKSESRGEDDEEKSQRRKEKRERARTRKETKKAKKEAEEKA